MVEVSTLTPAISLEGRGGTLRSAKLLPDESNREAIEEMLWHAVQWAQEQPEWTEQVAVVEVKG